MLGGEMNVRAASLLYEQGASGTFVFSTGTSQKTIAAYGPHVPTEASVYRDAFLALIKEHQNSKPTIILEETSVNTHSNLVECSKIIQARGWRHVAVLSLRYHIARVQALWELFAKNQHEPAVDFLVAEDVIVQAAPGASDAAINKAYRSEQGKKRLSSEAKGLRDLQAGKYVVTEFQLSNPSQN